MKLEQLKLNAPRIEMLPLIDVVFLLLVFFIYAMLSMVVHRGQTVDLPVSSTAPVQMQEAVAITIKDIGGGVQFFLAGKAVSVERFGRELQALSLDAEVQIFADKTISYQELFQVMDQLKTAGLTKISLQAVVADHG